MKNLKFTLRLFTLAAYFAPFVFYMSTCVGTEYRSAYNKKEAFENIAEAQREQLKNIEAELENFKSTLTSENKKEKLDSLKEILFKRLDPFTSADRVNMIKDSLDHNLRQNIMLSVIYPTNYSVSGIAVILDYKNIHGQILLTVSGIISLLTLFLWRVMKRKKNLVLFALLANLVCVAIFMIDGLVHHVDLLWGSWALFLLLMIQLLQEIREAGDNSRLKT